MRKWWMFVLLWGILSNLWGENLVKTETMPNEKFKKVRSLALYKFDGKLINSGRISLIDYIEVTDKFHKYLLKKFQEVPNFEIVNAVEKITVVENDAISIRRGRGVPGYDEKKFGNKNEFSEDAVKTIEASLYGKITRFYEGKDFETSYIELIIYLVDTKTKTIYWVTSIKGCLKFVVDTIVKTIASGEYTEPTTKDIKKFEWRNPYEMRVKDRAFEYRRGYFIPLSDKLESGGNHIFAFYFKMPLFLKIDIYNQIEFNIIPSLKSADKNNPLKDYQYTTYLPLFFNFIYNFEKITKIKSLRPFAKAGLGTSFISTYYSGTGRYIKTENQIDGMLCLGIGVEYTLKIGIINLWKFYIKINKLGFLGCFDYYKWFSASPASNGFNLSLGIKYYL